MGTMDKEAARAMDRAFILLAVLAVVALALLGWAGWKLVGVVFVFFGWS